MPFAGVALNRAGAVRACLENAERLLSRDGLIDYLTARDYAAVQGLVTFFAVVVVVVSLLVDVINAAIDPRVRY